MKTELAPAMEKRLVRLAKAAGRTPNIPQPPDEKLREHYAHTALARMGIPFERAMECDSVRIVVEGAAHAENRRGGKCSQGVTRSE